MVCQKCEAKLAKLANPDVWRDGGRNNTTGYGKGAWRRQCAAPCRNYVYLLFVVTDSGGRKLGENMLLKNKKMNRPGPCSRTCRTCKGTMYQEGVYCSACAHRGGFCAVCGKKMVDVSNFRMDLGNKFDEVAGDRAKIKQREEQRAAAKAEQEKIVAASTD
eukprot:GEMP01086544.1.p2 GENE.GEMP01086544.1~~GEMP01086544.1.p2  ORF type:complete len:161 (+),score=34.04 GEMP01086544.1:253-735(+)